MPNSDLVRRSERQQAFPRVVPLCMEDKPVMEVDLFRTSQAIDDRGEPLAMIGLTLYYIEERKNPYDQGETAAVDEAATAAAVEGLGTAGQA